MNAKLDRKKMGPADVAEVTLKALVDRRPMALPGDTRLLPLMLRVAPGGHLLLAGRLHVFTIQFYSTGFHALFGNPQGLLTDLATSAADLMPVSSSGVSTSGRHSAKAICTHRAAALRSEAAPRTPFRV